jgi:hypothetical protein
MKLLNNACGLKYPSATIRLLKENRHFPADHVATIIYNYLKFLEQNLDAR